MPLTPGAVFAGYTIERQLGAGGMGVVYLAHHPRLPRFDAVKLLSRELSADPDFAARFEREADLAARLVHPNIVSVNDRGFDDGQLWISMQFVDGMDCEAALGAAGGVLPAERAVRIVGGVGAGLDAAHRSGLVHRDVKPANVLLADSGEADEPEQVYLTDFGIAKALDEAVKLTRTGSVIATFDYASPEQLEGKPLDSRTDVYSLGCLLYRLLTGSVPYPGDTVAVPIHGHLALPPPRPTGRVPWLPPGLDDVVATAMAKDPADRFPTCRALAVAARTALLDRPAALPTRRDVPARSADSGAVLGGPPVPTLSGGAPWPAGSIDTPPAVGPAPAVPARPYGRMAALTDPAGARTAPPTTVGRQSAPAWQAVGADRGPVAPPPPDDVSRRASAPPVPRRRHRTLLVLALIAGLAATAAVVLLVLLRDDPGDSRAGGATTTATLSGTVSSAPPPVPGLPSAEPLPDDTVVFSRQVDGNIDLYLVDAATDTIGAQLTTGTAADFVPLISPDRRSIVYFQAAGDRNVLRVMAADGSGDRALFTATPAECAGELFQPAWNPADPTVLALSCGDAAGDRSLRLVTVDGQLVRELATPKEIVDDLTFSPDGAVLTFWAGHERAAQGGSLWSVRTDGSGAPVQLTDVEAGVDGDPAWSPDGEEIAFRRLVDGGSDIFVMAADGSGQRALASVPGSDWDPTWSPDGAMLGFLSDRPGGSAGQEAQFWVMLADGSAQRQLLVGAPGSLFFSAAWSRR